MNILVTGGTGFVGINFIPALISKGHSVRVLCRNRKKAISLFGNSCEIVVGDITDVMSLTGCCDDIDVVYHMVAKVGNELPNEHNFIAFRKVNVEGTQNIVNEAKKAGISKFIFISSIAAMGIVHEDTIDEKSKCNPYLPYQVTKLEGEMIILNEFQKTGFPGIVIRPTKIFGVGENEYSYLMLAKLCKIGFLPKIGSGKNYTSNLYITDLVQGLVQLVDRGCMGEVYIFTSNNSIGFCDSAEIVAKEMNRKIHFVKIPSWLMIQGARIIERAYLFLEKKAPVTEKNILATTTDRIYNISKAIDQLGFNPLTSMDEGIAKVVKYYKQENII
jgi:nucleoside-diphosphate-sugar epimerase